MKKILIFGSATADIALRIKNLPSMEEDINPEGQTISLGGCACNVSAILNMFHVRNTLAVPVGKGIYGDFVRKELAKRNIPVWKESSEINGSCTCLVTDDGNRTFLAVHGAEYHYRSEWLDSLDPDDYQMVYICGIDMEEDTNVCIIDWLEKHRIPVCFACGPRIASLQKERLERIMNLHPILHLNAREAGILLERTGKPVGNIRENVQTLSQLVQNLTIITDGSKGCVASDEDCLLEIPSFPVRQKDGTGAGDSHIGTTLACLTLGKDLRTSLETAAIIAAEVVQTEGPVLSQSQFEKLKYSFPD